MVNEGRLQEISSLSVGGHPDIESGYNIIEAASYVAGEPWSTWPESICPTIIEFMLQWNDDLSDRRRSDVLIPLIPFIIGTRATPHIERQRSLMAGYWLVQTHLPRWLSLAGLEDSAKILSTILPFSDLETNILFNEQLEKARLAASDLWRQSWTKAQQEIDAIATANPNAPAIDAPWRDGLNAGAETCREAAAFAANYGVKSPLWAAAAQTALDASRSVSGKNLQPTVDHLVASAQELIKQMARLT